MPGESELGDWVLEPSEHFARYAVSVEEERRLMPAEHQCLRPLVEYLKLAHTDFVDVAEPLPPILPEHWELRLSDLSETTTLHLLVSHLVHCPYAFPRGSRRGTLVLPPGHVAPRRGSQSHVGSTGGPPTSVRGLVEM